MFCNFRLVFLMIQCPHFVFVMYVLACVHVSNFIMHVCMVSYVCK